MDNHGIILLVFHVKKQGKLELHGITSTFLRGDKL